MMPKRLQDCAPDVRAAGIRRDEQTFADRPALARLITEIISAWSIVESTEALAFIMLSGSEGRRAVAIYSQLKGRFAREALCAIAREELRATDRHIFFSALRVIDGVRQHRDLLAHGVLGHSSADPSLLVVVPQAVNIRHMRALFLDRHLVRSPHEEAEIKKDAAEDFLANAVVYSEADLHRIAKECTDATELMTDLAVLVAEVHPEKDATRRRLLERFPMK